MKAKVVMMREAFVCFIPRKDRHTIKKINEFIVRATKHEEMKTRDETQDASLCFRVGNTRSLGLRGTELSV